MITSRFPFKIIGYSGVHLMRQEKGEILLTEKHCRVIWDIFDISQNFRLELKVEDRNLEITEMYNFWMCVNK